MAEKPLNFDKNAGPRRVGIVLRAYGPPWNEGVRNLAHALGTYLQGRGTKVVVLAASVRGKDLPSELPTVEVPCKNRLLFPLAAGQYARRMGLQSLVYFTDYSIIAGLKTCLVRWSSGARTTVYLPGLSPPYLPRDPFLYASFSRRVVGSPFLTRYVPRAEVIPPWVGLERSVQNSSLRQRRNRLLFLGSLERGRGVPILLQALALIRKRRVDGQLYIGWNGEGARQLEAIQNLIRDLSLTESVTFLDVNERVQAYEQTDVVVIPHTGKMWMAFPVRILEAAQAGKPVVVTSTCGMDSLIAGCGLSVPANDPHSMSEALEKLLTDDQLYEDCQRHCWEFFERYRPEKSLESLCRTL